MSESVQAACTSTVRWTPAPRAFDIPGSRCHRLRSDERGGVRSAPRIVAAALVGSAIAGLVVVGLAAGAGSRAAATVTLQVAPRGPGTVSVSPLGGGGDTNPCDSNDGDSSCTWTYERGKSVKLTAAVLAEGKSFSGWSTPDCPGTGSCTVTLDQDVTTIVATFNPLTLGVRLSSSNKGRVTSNPAGIDCQAKSDDKCSAQFSPHTRVTLTATPAGANTLRTFSPSCEKTGALTCTITVDDQTTWAGVAWNNDQLPQLATTINVQFQLRKGGNGSGRVKASNLDCGSSCTAKFGFGKSVTLTAAPDQGSVVRRVERRVLEDAADVHVRGRPDHLAQGAVCKGRDSPDRAGRPQGDRRDETGITIAGPPRPTMSA